MWTDSFGGFGGEFTEFYSNDWYFTRVRGRSGDWIDQISFDFENRSTGELETIYEYGGEGGEPFDWSLPEGENITKISVWAVQNQFVHGLEFSLEGGDAAMIGKQTGQKFEIDLTGKKLSGFRLRSGAYVDQISLFLTSAK